MVSENTLCISKYPTDTQWWNYTLLNTLSTPETQKTENINFTWFQHDFQPLTRRGISLWTDAIRCQSWLISKQPNVSRLMWVSCFITVRGRELLCSAKFSWRSGQWCTILPEEYLHQILYYYYIIIMVALCNRADHYIFILFLSSFFLLLLLFFSSPNLSGRRLDVYHTLAHGVALVRI